MRELCILETRFVAGVGSPLTGETLKLLEGMVTREMAIWTLIGVSVVGAVAFFSFYNSLRSG